MKDIAKILLYFLGTVLLGAVLAPLLFWAGQFVADHGVATFLKTADFHRFFDRGILIAAIVLLWPLARSLNIRKISDFGLKPNAQWKRDLFLGLAVAIVSSLALTACAALLHAWRMPPPSRWIRLLAILPTAAVVAALEEMLFRGAIQGIVQRSTSRTVTVIFVAALFAIVHFLKPPQQDIPAETIGWLSGFALIPQTLWQFENPVTLLGGFTTLFVVALILGFARLKTLSLWLPAGLHAGWIIGKTIGTTGWTKSGRHGSAHLPWFGADLLTGLCPVLILLATGALLVWWLEKRAPATKLSA